MLRKQFFSLQFRTTQPLFFRSMCPPCCQPEGTISLIRGGAWFSGSSLVCSARLFSAHQSAILLLTRATSSSSKESSQRLGKEKERQKGAMARSERWEGARRSALGSFSRLLRSRECPPGPTYWRRWLAPLDGASPAPVSLLSLLLLLFSSSSALTSPLLPHLSGPLPIKLGYRPDGLKVLCPQRRPHHINGCPLSSKSGLAWFWVQKTWSACVGVIRERGAGLRGARYVSRTGIFQSDWLERFLL